MLMTSKRNKWNQVWWPTPIIPAVWEDQKLKPSPGNLLRSCLKIEIINNNSNNKERAKDAAQPEGAGFNLQYLTHTEARFPGKPFSLRCE